MQSGMGPPDTLIRQYPMADDSWERELEEFLEDILLNRCPNPGVEDAIAALSIVGKVYQDNST